MFAWIRQLVEAVPSDWSPNLQSAAPGERVLGKLPGDIFKAYLATIYARQQALDIEEVHHQDHLANGPDTKESCLDVHNRADRLTERADLLSVAVSTAIRDFFNLGLRGDVQVRREGVVFIDEPVREERENPFEMLAAMLAGGRPPAGLSVGAPILIDLPTRDPKER